MGAAEASHVECRHCKEAIRHDATHCRHCRLPQHEEAHWLEKAKGLLAVVTALLSVITVGGPALHQQLTPREAKMNITVAGGQGETIDLLVTNSGGAAGGVQLAMVWRTRCSDVVKQTPVQHLRVRNPGETAVIQAHSAGYVPMAERFGSKERLPKVVAEKVNATCCLHLKLVDHLGQILANEQDFACQI